MNKFIPFSLILLLLGFFVLSSPLPVLAHDFTMEDLEIGGVGEGFEIEAGHEEEDPFKGWLNIEVTNTGDESWGDFHFQIIQWGSETVENVDFIVADPNQPTSSQDGLTWVVDNDTVGATIDLYFYSDPVLPGESATFSVYTDNTTDENSWFGVCFHPTPVPVPSAVLLLVTGIIGIVGIRRFKE